MLLSWTLLDSCNDLLFLELPQTNCLNAFISCGVCISLAHNMLNNYFNQTSVIEQFSFVWRSCVIHLIRYYKNCFSYKYPSECNDTKPFGRTKNTYIYFAQSRTYYYYYTKFVIFHVMKCSKRSCLQER